METTLDQLASLSLICYQKETDFIGIPRDTQQNFIKHVGPGGALVGVDRTTKLLFGILRDQIYGNFDQLTVQDQVLLSVWLPHVSKLEELLHDLRPVYPQISSSLELCHLLIFHAKFV